MPKKTKLQNKGSKVKAKSGKGGVSVSINIDQSKISKSRSQPRTAKPSLPAFSASPERGGNYLGASNAGYFPVMASTPIGSNANQDLLASYNNLLLQGARAFKSRGDGSLISRASNIGTFETSNRQVSGVIGSGNVDERFVMVGRYPSLTERIVDDETYDDPTTNNPFPGSRVDIQLSLPQTGPSSITELNKEERQDNALSNLKIHSDISSAKDKQVEHAFDAETDDGTKPTGRNITDEFAGGGSQEKKSGGSAQRQEIRNLYPQHLEKIYKEYRELNPKPEGKTVDVLRPYLIKVNKRVIDKYPINGPKEDLLKHINSGLRILYNNLKNAE